MDIGAWAARAREHAALLLATVDDTYPEFRDRVLTGSVADALTDTFGFTISIVDDVAAGCSVAGNSDPRTGTIEVVSAPTPRMRYTALHEAAHLLGDDHDEFQEALLQAGSTSTTRDVEEDACEAFAAALLLPDATVDAVLDTEGRTARGFIALTRTRAASMEASAVAVAQRLTAPGYVMVVHRDGTAQFAARSGDELPISRGSSQTDSVLTPVLNGPQTRVRTRGRLRYRTGTYTDELQVDAEVANGVVFVVACTDQPDWPALNLPSRTRIDDRLVAGWCAQCSVEFYTTNTCARCGEPVHAECNSCECEIRPAHGERTCTVCFEVKPARCFPGPEPVCEEHSRPR